MQPQRNSARAARQVPPDARVELIRAFDPWRFVGYWIEAEPLRLTAAARPVPRQMNPHRAQARAPHSSRSARASASASGSDDGGDGAADPPRVAPDSFWRFASHKKLRRFLKQLRRKIPRPARVELIRAFDPSVLNADYARTIYLAAATILEGRFSPAEREALRQQIADRFGLAPLLVAQHISRMGRELIRDHGQRKASAVAPTDLQEPAPAPADSPTPDREVRR